jgi:hypothetical protein
VLSDVLGIVAGVVVVGAGVLYVRNPSAIRRGVRDVAEQRSRRRGSVGPVSEAHIERGVKAGRFAGWTTLVLATFVTVWLCVRFVVAVL